MDEVGENANGPSEMPPLEKVRRDLRALMEDSEELVQATAEDMGAKTQETRRRVAEAVEQAKETCKKLENRAWNDMKEKGREVEQYTHEHPYQTMGIAFGVGVLLGLMVNRR